MAFVSWTTIYNNWLDALANRDPDSFFNSSYENSREMRVTYTKLANIQEFTAWLKSKADQESEGFEEGDMISCIGGA